MSQDHSLSTDDLAGRQAPRHSEATAPPAATGASDPGPPPGGAVGDDRWTDDTDRIRTADVSDHDVSDPGVSDPGVSDPSVTDHDVSDHDVSDRDASDPSVSDHDVSDPGVSDPGVSGYGDTPAATTGDGATSADASEDGGRDAGAAEDGQQRPDDEEVWLVDSAQAEEFRARWADVQVRFVDDPKAAVGAAGALVAEAMESLASAFADHKSRLETQWQGGDDVDTEELRLALRRYRGFFHRLLEN